MDLRSLATPPTARDEDSLPTPNANKNSATRSRTHMTLAEVCEELGIGRSTFYDWRAKRRAPRCFKLPNGDLRIRRADFEDWIAARLEDAA